MRLVTKFQFVLSAVMLIPALAAELFAFNGEEITREDGMDC
ncbi:hypothetical protein PHYC_03928 [Phycisphaerales bacterium]|nr:hypothetical protein PHYC_03928 [Phycisphaerales bacterium]